MACGKPPNPDRITSPTPLSHPTAQPASIALRDAEALIGQSSPGKEVDDAIKWATRMLERASAAGLDDATSKRLEHQLAQLKAFAQARLKDNVSSPAPPRGPGDAPTSNKWVLKQFSEPAAVRNAPIVMRALRDPDHWRSKEYTTILLRMVQGNARIPDSYKEQLPSDVAEVLRVCPNAAGIVKAMTLRGQGTPLASPGKLGSDANAAIGSAYELMGTAALARQTSTAVNGGPRLYIDPAVDTVTFGIKSNINRQANHLGLIELPTRRTIECDVRIGRKESPLVYREIGIDFKHGAEARPKYVSDDLRNQVDNVVQAINHGQIHEYHFVTNTTFGNSFREVIDAANQKLGHTAIGCHEHVTSLPPSLI